MVMKNTLLFLVFASMGLNATKLDTLTEKLRRADIQCKEKTLTPQQLYEDRLNAYTLARIQFSIKGGGYHRVHARKRKLKHLIASQLKNARA